MDIRVTHGPDAQAAINALKKLSDQRPDFISMHLNSDLTKNGWDLASDPGLPQALHGATSCLGAMAQEGANDGASIFAIYDTQGDYGTSMVSFGDDVGAAAAQATKNALAQADRVGEQPHLVWIAATPGQEESVIAGIESVVGGDVPIIGGSAADNSVSGNWCVFDRSGSASAGVVVSVLFPSTPISFAYQNGYSPTAHEGTVTKVTGRRIEEIDGRPAMDVYSEWTGGQVPKANQTDQGGA